MKTIEGGTSPGVQWLRLLAASAGAQVPSPVRELDPNATVKMLERANK
jgi:hypothetical protein